MFDKSPEAAQVAEVNWLDRAWSAVSGMWGAFALRSEGNAERHTTTEEQAEVQLPMLEELSDLNRTPLLSDPGIKPGE